MKDILVDDFQYTAQELLVRNRSILDLITKYQDSNSRVNRAVIKSVTQCGCLTINAHKQDIPADANFDEMKNSVNGHVEGTLCDNCRDAIERDIGRNLFYLASICNTLDLNLYDIILKENDRIRMLGKYNLR
ncbi:hypothetical protein Cpap_2008 [Ruminiclostridium papyrosolvens DSM 2782]|uniref:DUF1573 domain-containing protein n=1 Tax=Ruminiclostridium papyrosolvens DSM 2782 TaxID=588581 RepID=F1TDX9_9FIRM|nr:hypothetical protein [Ruminiclostridium papyrosolvens]EGD47425.1 hypothetical protein Cpap_2008 [Ruminiclostridium papyrosolvens DSM 2782]WES34767.1 DUF1573 domain-containing protein [Ruminiclostridium papyrosolvens DSM 2782]